MVNIVLSVITAALLGYLLGSINSAIIFVKLLRGEDVRNFGSGNAGLTNTLRCFGKNCAILTLIGDLSKGVIAVVLSRVFCGLLDGGIFDGKLTSTHYVGYIAGFFAVIGHIFPIYYGFKGGKGVLVGVSTFIAVDPLLFAILIAIFATVLTLSKYVSLASIIAACTVAPLTFAMQYFLFGVKLNISLLYTVLSFIMAMTVIVMHKENIKRLASGTENRFSFKKK